MPAGQRHSPRNASKSPAKEHNATLIIEKRSKKPKRHHFDHTARRHIRYKPKVSEKSAAVRTIPNRPKLVFFQ
jgi:hypothetical protein